MHSTHTVDHALLLSHPNCDVGISSSALKWFTSYLTDRTFSPMIGICPLPVLLCLVVHLRALFSVLSILSFIYLHLFQL